MASFLSKGAGDARPSHCCPTPLRNERAQCHALYLHTEAEHQHK